MAYNPYPIGSYPMGGYQPGGYAPGVPDQLAQLRQAQMQQPMLVQPQPAAPQQGQAGGIIWVQGEAGAKAYPVAPGGVVSLWDSENQTIYIKSADMSGLPSMRVLDYTERGGPPAQAPAQDIDLSAYITREELESILAERLKRPARAPKPKEDTENG